MEDKLKELIVRITADHDTDTLEEVLDGYVAQIIQAFKDEGYRRYPQSAEEEKMIANIKSKASNYMTGPEWLARLREALPVMPAKQYLVVLKAAKKASGIK